MTRPLVVYDTMVFVQWALLRTDRQHRTAAAVDEARVTLCVGARLIAELGRALRYPELRAKAPHLDDSFVTRFTDAIVQRASWIDPVPEMFKHSAHAKDDHVFDLAIAAKADYLVTWENRHLQMAERFPDEFGILARLTPRLKVIDPASFARVAAPNPEPDRLKTHQPAPHRDREIDKEPER